MGGWQDDNWGRNWEAWKSSSWDWEAWESPDRPSSWHEAWKSQDWTSQDSQEAWKSQCSSSSNDEAWKSQSTFKAWKSRGDDDEESLNSHLRPSGSGTTSKARQERRKNKQWATLEKKAQEHVPDNVEDMQAHLEQMEKAKAKMESRLAELQQEGQQGLGKASEQQGLGKASEQQGLGKASSSPSSSSSSKNRSTSKSSQKKKKKKKMSTVEEEPEEPDWEVETEEEKEEQLGKADDSTSEASRPAVLSKRGKQGARSSGEEPGKKPKIVLKPRRPTVQIDYHNCLEKQGSVPKAHWQALLALGKACDYYICSYVTTKKREDEVQRHLQACGKGDAQEPSRRPRDSRPCMCTRKQASLEKLQLPTRSVPTTSLMTPGESSRSVSTGRSRKWPSRCRPLSRTTTGSSRGPQSRGGQGHRPGREPHFGPREVAWESYRWSCSGRLGKASALAAWLGKALTKNERVERGNMAWKSHSRSIGSMAWKSHTQAWKSHSNTGSMAWKSRTQAWKSHR